MAKRRKLTDVTVRKIQVPITGREEHWDSETPGLGLRVTHKGTRSWVLLYRIGGRQRRLTFGPYPAISLAAARTLAREAMVEVARGNDPAAIKAEAKRARGDTLADVASQFIEIHAKREIRSRKATER